MACVSYEKKKSETRVVFGGGNFSVAEDIFIWSVESLCRPLKREARLRTAVWVQAKVRERGLGMWPGLYASRACNDNAAIVTICMNLKLPLPLNCYQVFRRALKSHII